MNEITAATLADVEALTQQRWPSDPLDARHLIRSQFQGRPQVLDGLVFGYENSTLSHVGWFISHHSAEELRQEHDAFCDSLSLLVGSAADFTPTTAMWLTNGFVIESYAHLPTVRDPHCTHQIGVGCPTK